MEDKCMAITNGQLDLILEDRSLVGTVKNTIISE